MTNNIQHIRYKKLYAGVAFAFAVATAHAQQVNPPESNVPQSSTISPVLSRYPGIHDLKTNVARFNYVRTILPDEPLKSTPALSNFYRQSTAYFDGLGRPLQTVVRKGHADGNDLVNVKVYDSMGRETYQYLPYAAPISGAIMLSAFGNIKTNDSTQMRDFYDHNGPDEQPYGQTVYEASTLGRPVKTMSPGRSWVGAGRGVTYSYFTNTIWSYNDGFYAGALGGGFPRWTMANTPGALPVYAGQYAPGQLSVTLVTDEDGKNSMEMKDKEGHVVMKLAGLTTKTWGTTARPLDYAYTCYIYDEMGRLRGVLPPEAAKPVAADSHGSATWSNISQAQMDGLCFSYLYDSRSRVVEKKIPGKTVEYYVYDQRDRLVFSQDGNLRPQGKWLFNLFDGLDRTTATGIVTYSPSATRAAVQGYVYQGNPSGIATNDILYYILNTDLYNTYPPDNLTNCQLLTYNYYDDYSQLSGLDFDAAQFNGVTIPTGNNAVVPSVLSNLTRGFATGGKVRVLDPENPTSNVWLSSAYYYDVNGRKIQTVAQNFRGDIDISSNIYYFQGMLWKNIMKHVNNHAVIIAGATDSAITNYTLVNTYDRNLIHAGGNDLTAKHKQKINGGGEYELSDFSYDHLGRNTLKQWTAGLSLNEYNIRGFQTHTAFRKYNLDTAFNESICYDTGFASKLYNGDIAGITWWGADHTRRAYGYSYDGLNRLTHAEFNEYDNNSWNKSAGVDFTASNITYDLNGNMKTMNQMAPKPLSPVSVMMDALTYTYAANSNQMKNVKDPADRYDGLPDFKDDLNGNDTTVQEYVYDANGNLQSDLNKQISSIAYNYLNKPEKISVTGKGVVTYVYDANGTRLSKKLTYSGNTQPEETWDYMGNFVYKNNELQYILNEEGRARPVLASNDSFPEVPVGEHQTKFVYDYFVKDHLGNVRSTVTSKPTAYVYLATHNISTANIEDLIFDNIETVRDTKPGSGDPDDMAARLNGQSDDLRIGTAIMLETNAGDHIKANVASYYSGGYQEGKELTSSQILESLMGTLLGGSTVGTKTGELTAANRSIIKHAFSSTSLPGELDLLQETNYNENAPKAHLTYLWFDDKFKFRADYSGSLQVAENPDHWATLGGGDPYNTTVQTPDGVDVTFPGHGFVVIYIDNQSIGKDVWFDSLSISNFQGTVMEEDHYYPFGLTLNTTPAGFGKQNPYKLVSKELESRFDLNMYDFGSRTYDMTGPVWGQVDKKAEKYYSSSPYAYCGNNPVNYVDKTGDDYFYMNDQGACIAHITTTDKSDVFYHISDDMKVVKFAEQDKTGPVQDGSGVFGNAYSRLTDKQKVGNAQATHWYVGKNGNRSFQTKLNPELTTAGLAKISFNHLDPLKNDAGRVGAVGNRDQAEGTQNSEIEKWNVGGNGKTVITITAGMPVDPTAGAITNTVTSGSPLPTPENGQEANVDPSTRFTPLTTPPQMTQGPVESQMVNVSTTIVNADGNLVPTNQQKPIITPVK